MYCDTIWLTWLFISCCISFLMTLRYMINKSRNPNEDSTMISMMVGAREPCGIGITGSDSFALVMQSAGGLFRLLHSI